MILQPRLIRTRKIRKILCYLATFGIFSIVLFRHYSVPDVLTRFEQELKHSKFANFDNEIGAENGQLIVPNIIHFIIFNTPNITFPHFICILAALRNQRPEKIYFHTNVVFEGPYWARLLSLRRFKDVLVVKETEMPTDIFNQSIRLDMQVFHGGDVARMRVLMEYGGIYLDTDTYIIQSLDFYRRFEMSVGWDKTSPHPFGNQIIVAHKDARFLKLWFYSYENAYDTNRWYYNAAELPTETILRRRPDLVHAVKKLFGHDTYLWVLFVDYWPPWRKQYAIHLLTRKRYQKMLFNISSEATYPVDFNEHNLQKYPITFKEMANEVLDYEKSLRLGGRGVSFERRKKI